MLTPAEQTRPRIHANGKYTEEIAQAICRRIACGETLTAICSDPRLPSLRTVTYWLADKRFREFRDNYYHARRVAAEIRVDEIIDIVDNRSNDYTIVYDDNGDPVDLLANHANVQRDRLRVDTRKWLAAKLLPKLYGERVSHDLEATGELAEMLKAASNRSTGLPKPAQVQEGVTIEHEPG